MDEFLSSLTDADRRLLTENATHAHFEADEVILREGERRRALYVIRKGTARIMRAHEDFEVEISRLDIGEVFGEMSLVEDVPASASVIAAEPADVEIIGQEHVEALTRADEGFAGRFYRSLAVMLSRRLRETTRRGLEGYSWGGDVAAWERARGPEDEDGQTKGADGWGGGSPVQEYTRRRE